MCRDLASALTYRPSISLLVYELEIGREAFEYKKIKVKPQGNANHQDLSTTTKIGNEHSRLARALKLKEKSFMPRRYVQLQFAIIVLSCTYLQAMHLQLPETPAIFKKVVIHSVTTSGRPYWPKLKHLTYDSY